MRTVRSAELLAPVQLEMVEAVLAAGLVGHNGHGTGEVEGARSGFHGDLIVIFYLLTIPSLTYVIGALASGNPLAAVGGSREMKSGGKATRQCGTR